MPTYQYACTDCGHQLEAVQSFTDDALTECPECSGRLRKLFGNVGVVFKGSGFYRTDSRSKDGSASTPAKDSSSTPSTPAAGASSGSSSSGSSGGGSSSSGSSGGSSSGGSSSGSSTSSTSS